VLGVLVARAAGQPFEDVLRTRLFEPLGMRDTAFWTPRTERLATGYLPTQMGLKVWDEPDGRWSRRPDFADGAGGLVSTADDLLGPGFFENLSWGFCQAVYPDGAFGWNGGFGTSWLVEPDEDLTVIVLTQRLFESPEPPPVHVDIRAAALETGKAM
jgi:CubicO group peptidase (beta-lactamase class C family)